MAESQRMTLEISPWAELLRVTLLGRFSLAEAQRKFSEMLAAVSSHGLTNVLVDTRGLAGSPTDDERYAYAAYAAAAVAEFDHRKLDRAPRFAYVMHAPLRDPGRFGENVAVNRGMNVRTFDRPEAAVEWLERSPTRQLPVQKA